MGVEPIKGWLQHLHVNVKEDSIVEANELEEEGLHRLIILDDVKDDLWCGDLGECMQSGQGQL